MEKKVKTVGVQYLVKINEQLSEARASLREARALIKSIPLTEEIKKVTVTKLTTTEQILDIYEPRQIVVLSANQLDEGLGEG